jgi:hypothetical protein
MEMTIRTFALVLGILYLGLGIFGFVPPLVSAAPNPAPDVGMLALYGYLLGFFPVNFILNLVHLATGAWGVAASRGAGGARAYSRTVAVFYAILAVIGMVPEINTLFGIAPLQGHNVWLHGLTAIAAGFFGFIWAAAVGTRTRSASAH